MLQSWPCCDFSFKVMNFVLKVSLAQRSTVPCVPSILIYPSYILVLVPVLVNCLVAVTKFLRKTT
jgi:hypothetical protein